MEVVENSFVKCVWRCQSTKEDHKLLGAVSLEQWLLDLNGASCNASCSGRIARLLVSLICRQRVI